MNEQTENRLRHLFNDSDDELIKRSVLGQEPVASPEMMRRLKDVIVEQGQATTKLTKTTNVLTGVILFFTVVMVGFGGLQIWLLVR